MEENAGRMLALQQQKQAQQKQEEAGEEQQQRKRQALLAGGYAVANGMGHEHGAVGGARAPAARPAARQPQQEEEADSEEEPESVQWVQCSQCSLWRQVPDEHWSGIQNADPDDEWLCRDALWRVEEYEPHAPACC